MHMCSVAQSCPSNSATAWTLACQAPLSMEFFRQESWSGLPCPPPGDLPDPGIKPAPPALAGGFFTTEPPGKPYEHTHKHIHTYITHVRTCTLFLQESDHTRLSFLKFALFYLTGSWASFQVDLAYRFNRCMVFQCMNVSWFISQSPIAGM